jgi:hypothetical protein
MIVFRGWGILALVFAVVGLLAGLSFAEYAGVVAPAGPGKDASGDFANPFVAIALLVMAFVNWLVGRRVNDALDRREGVPRGVIDDRERGYFRHSLGNVRFEYWSLPMAVGAVVAFVSFVAR